MTKWERKRKQEQAKQKAADKAHLAHIKDAVKLMAKVHGNLKPRDRWSEDRKATLGKALDILAGMLVR